MLHASIPSYSRETLQDPYHVSVFPLNVWMNIFRSQGFKLKLRILLKFWIFFAVSWFLTRFNGMPHKNSRMISFERRPIPIRFIQWIKWNYKLVLNKV